MLKKIKKVKLSTLDAKLWKLFSKFIRLRDRVHGDHCRCISCNKIMHWKSAHAGHFINRRHLGVKFDERNVNAQCVMCNTFGEGEQYKYGLALIKKYGENVIQDLEVKKKLDVNIADRLWYLAMIEKCTEKLKGME